MHVADALHAEAEQGLEGDLVARTGALDEGDLGGSRAPGARHVLDALLHRGHDLGRRIHHAGDVAR
jgi:hypothetical protein